MRLEQRRAVHSSQTAEQRRTTTLFGCFHFDVINVDTVCWPRRMSTFYYFFDHLAIQRWTVYFRTPIPEHANIFRPHPVSDRSIGPHRSLPLWTICSTHYPTTNILENVLLIVPSVKLSTFGIATRKFSLTHHYLFLFLGNILEYSCLIVINSSEAVQTLRLLRSASYYYFI